MTDTLKNLPPQNIEAEEAILGGILLDPEALGRIVDILFTDAFYVQAHQQIYRAALTLFQQGQPTDLMTVSSWLSDQGILEKIGGNVKLAQLIDRTVSAVNIDRYSEIVMEKYLRRQLIKAGHEVVDLGYDTVKPLEKVLDEAEQKIFNLSQEKPQEGFSPIADTLVETFNSLEELHSETALPGLPCNFYDLDGKLGGFSRSDLIIIAGRPAMGKCLAADAEIVLKDGSIATIAEIFKQKEASLLTLKNNWQFELTKPCNFIDDGIKPVFRVKTKLGRYIDTTLTHPYLTIEGWKKLGELKVGNKIAVPREIKIFGREKMPEDQVKLLAYFIGDGCLTGTSPQFTNNNSLIQEDFIKSVNEFKGVKIRKETSQGKRTPTFYVTGDLKFIKTERKSFSETLRKLLDSQDLSDRKIAELLTIIPALICSWKKGDCVPNKETFNKLCNLLKIEPKILAKYEIETISNNSKNSVTLWLQSLKIWGKNAHQKTIPPVIFTLEKELIALFLNRLFATDGWASVLKTGQVQLGYGTVSQKLAQQIQHLLLRFGIISSLKERHIKYNNTLKKSWQIDITHSESIKLFIENIGIYGKETAINLAKEALVNKKNHHNSDLIPVEIWSKIETIKGAETWSSLAAKMGLKSQSNLHVGQRSLSRNRLFQIGLILDNLELQQIATSAIYWDEIVSIEYLGEQQVYDLTIPKTHNFVANNICVHNTSFALNIASNIAELHNLPVAIFSLEMSKQQLSQRLLSSEAKIESNRLRTGRFTQNEYEPLMNAIAKLSALPIFIDDSPNISVMQMRSQLRRLQVQQGGKLGLVLIDYLQLMEGGNSDNRVQELSKITRSLKALARELDVPVIALSQLSRGVEQRTNKRPMLSDLRESGSIEQDADIVMMLYRDSYYNPDSPDRDLAEINIAKHRNGPTGVIQLIFQPELTKFLNLAKGGY